MSCQCILGTDDLDTIIKIEKDGDEDSNLDVQTLLDRILRLKALLRNANQRSENPVENLDDLLYEGWDLESNATKWKKTAHLFKEELEKYKEAEQRHMNKHQLVYNIAGNDELNNPVKGMAEL